MVDHQQEQARALVRVVGLVQQVGGVPEELVEHLPLHRSRQLGGRIIGAHDVEAERRVAPALHVP